MRKVLSSITVILLATVFILPCFAASDTLNAPGDKEIPVYVSVVVGESKNVHTSEEGTGAPISFKTNDGLSVDVIPSEKDGSVTVYEIPSTDKDALKWLNKKVGDLADKCNYFNVSSENMPDGYSYDVTIDIPSNSKTTQVGFIDTDGKVTIIESKQNGDRISFTATKDGIYVLLTKVDNQGNPPTADVLTLTGIITVSLVILLIMFAKRKKKKERAGLR